MYKTLKIALKYQKSEEISNFAGHKSIVDKYINGKQKNNF